MLASNLGSPDQGLLNASSSDSSPISTSRVEAALRKFSKQAMNYEQKMKDLEVLFSTGLHDFRTINELMEAAVLGIEADTKRADRALHSQIPYINSELDGSMKELERLAETLPTIRSQVTDIRKVYNSGRHKAHILVSELQWLNTEFYERWRCTIFTSRSPVSWQWKALLRSLFAVSFVLCSYFLWVVLCGAYRAHRHRLVWGERLIS